MNQKPSILVSSSFDHQPSTPMNTNFQLDKKVQKIIAHINEDEFIEAMRNDQTCQQFLKLRISEIVVEVLHSEFESIINDFQGQIDSAHQLLQIEKEHQDALRKLHQEQIGRFEIEIAELLMKLKSTAINIERSESEVKELTNLNQQIRDEWRQDRSSQDSILLEFQVKYQAQEEYQKQYKAKKKAKIQGLKDESLGWKDKYQNFQLGSQQEISRLQRLVDSTVDESGRSTMKLTHQITALNQELRIVQIDRSSLEENIKAIKNEIATNYVSLSQHREIIAQTKVQNTSDSILKAAEIINQAVETKEIRDQQYITTALKELEQAKDEIAESEQRQRSEILILKDQLIQYRNEIENYKLQQSQIESAKRQIEGKYEDELKEIARLRIQLSEGTANERILSERIWNLNNQLAEQKLQQDHQVDDLKKQQNTLTKRLQEITEESQEEIDNLNKQKKSLKQTVASQQKQLEDSVLRVEEQLIKGEGFQRLFNEQDIAIEDLHRQSEILSEQLQDREAQFREHQKQSEQQILAAQNRAAQLQGIIDQQQGQLSASEQTLSEMDQLLKQIEFRLKEQELASSRTQQNIISNHEIAIDKFTQQIENDAKVIIKLQSDIARKDEEFEELQQKFKIYQGELEKIKGKIAFSMVEIIRRINEDLQSFKSATIDTLQSYDNAFTKFKFEIENAFTKKSISAQNELARFKQERQIVEGQYNQQLQDSERKIDQQLRCLQGIKNQLQQTTDEMMDLKTALCLKENSIQSIEDRYIQTTKELTNLRLSSSQVADIYEERIASLKRKMSEAEKEFQQESQLLSMNLKSEQQKLILSESSRNQLKQYIATHIDSNFENFSKNLQQSSEAAKGNPPLHSTRSSFYRYADSTFDQSPNRHTNKKPNKNLLSASPFSPHQTGSIQKNQGSNNHNNHEGIYTRGFAVNNLSAESQSLIRSHSAQEGIFPLQRQEPSQQYQLNQQQQQQYAQQNSTQKPQGNAGTPDKNQRNISHNNTSQKQNKNIQIINYGGDKLTFDMRHNKSQQFMQEISTSPQQQVQNSYKRRQKSNLDQPNPSNSGSEYRQSTQRTPQKPSIHYMIPNIPNSNSQSALLRQQKKDASANVQEYRNDHTMNLSFRAPFENRM